MQTKTKAKSSVFAEVKQKRMNSIVNEDAKKNKKTTITVSDGSNSCNASCYKK